MHLRLFASAIVALVLAGCGADGAAATGSFVAVIPPAPVTVNNETYVTHVHVEPAEAEPPAAAPAPVVASPPDPACVPDDVACLEAACTRGSALGCEARADLYRDHEDLRALVYYRRALVAFGEGCHDGDEGACANQRRLSTPGYGAHSYIAAPEGCPAGYLMSAAGCVVAGLAPGSMAVTVIVSGNHNLVQIFGGAPKK